MAKIFEKAANLRLYRFRRFGFGVSGGVWGLRSCKGGGWLMLSFLVFFLGWGRLKRPSSILLNCNECFWNVFRYFGDVFWIECFWQKTLKNVKCIYGEPYLIHVEIWNFVWNSLKCSSSTDCFKFFEHFMKLVSKLVKIICCFVLIIFSHHIKNISHPLFHYLV